jgi:hypothetical protein
MMTEHMNRHPPSVGQSLPLLGSRLLVSCCTADGHHCAVVATKAASLLDHILALVAGLLGPAAESLAANS